MSEYEDRIIECLQSFDAVGGCLGGNLVCESYCWVNLKIL